VESVAEAYRRIVRGKFSWPTDIKLGKKLKAIISELLTVDAEERLGAKGVETVYDHPWLENVNWRMMKARRYIVSLTIFFPPRRLKPRLTCRLQSYHPRLCL